MLRKVHIYHHNDNDGKFAASIMYLFFKRYGRKYRKAEFYSIDYITNIDLENISTSDYIVFVDYSFSNEHNKDQLLKAHSRGVPIIWIDHHKSSEEILNKLDRNSKDIQESDKLITYYDIDYSATRLCWIFCRYMALVRSSELDGENKYEYAKLLSKAYIPEFVKYIDAYDLWYFTKNDNAHLFNSGLMVEDCRPKSLISDLLDESSSMSQYNIFEDSIENINNKAFNNVQSIINNGKIILKYNTNNYKRNQRFGAFEFTISDNDKTYRCIAMNIHSNSEAFGELYDEYDIVCPFVMNKDGIWKYSLFTRLDDIDLSKYAGLIGNTENGCLAFGGHKKASGFQHKKLILTPNTNITFDDYKD